MEDDIAHVGGRYFFVDGNFSGMDHRMMKMTGDFGYWQARSKKTGEGAKKWICF